MLKKTAVAIAACWLLAASVARAAALNVFEDGNRAVILAGQRVGDYVAHRVELSRDWPSGIPAQRLFMPGGLLIRVRTLADFDTATARPGDVGEVEVLDDVYVNGRQFVVAGSRATVAVKNVLPAESWARDAAIVIEGRWLTTVNGIRVPLLLDLYRTDLRESVLMTWAVVGVAAFFVKGREVVVPAGTEFYVKVGADTDLGD
ncbi:MAG: hypothetical protein N3A57_01835 [Negativicutes bacterium]|nr:hypothetical protein [Negativicutes bacterium]